MHVIERKGTPILLLESMAARTPVYEEAAHLFFDELCDSPEETAEAILEKFPKIRF